MNHPSRAKNNIDFNRLKQETSESDFDGHTAFRALTFTQKLTWLSEAAVSTYILAKDNPSAWCNLIFTDMKKNQEKMA